MTVDVEVKLFCIHLMKILQFCQALLQTFNISIALITFAAAGTTLQKLHLHGQLTELKVLALLSQIHTATDRAVLRAQSCRPRHSQGVPMRKKT